MIESPERQWIASPLRRKVDRPVVTRCVSCGRRHTTKAICTPCTLCRSVEYTIPTRGVGHA